MITTRNSMNNSPPHLVAAVRALFDSLDAKHGSNGFIKYQEIVDDFNFGTNHRDLWAVLPSGFLNFVKKVIPFNGMLTYERLCTGLRLAVAEERGRSIHNGHESMGNGTANGNPIPLAPSTNPVVRAQRQVVHSSLSAGSSRNSSPLVPPVVPIRGPESLDRMKQLENDYYNYNGNNGSVRPYDSPNGIYADSNRWAVDSDHLARPHSQSPVGMYKKNANVYANGKGTKPQQSVMMSNGNRFQNQPQPPVYNQALSLSKLNLNQIEIIENGLRQQNQRSAFAKSTSHLNETPTNKPTTTNGVGVHHISPVGQKYVTGQRVEVVHSRPVSMQHLVNGNENENDQSSMVKLRNKKNNSVQATDNRRHTVTEGAEHNMMKHTRFLQEEKDLTSKCQETTVRLQNWLSDRLSNLETRQKLLGKSMVPLDFAVHEEKLNYLRAHVTELNRRMVALMESSEKGFPSYINVEVSRSIPQPADDQLMWLKRQNKMLTDEVTEKTQRIAVLEVEKTTLIKKLFDDSVKQQPQKETVYSLPVKNNHHVSLIKPNVAEPVLATLM